MNSIKITIKAIYDHPSSDVVQHWEAYDEYHCFIGGNKDLSYLKQGIKEEYPNSKIVVKRRKNDGMGHAS